ncbi:MAG: hypothetical protein KDH94_04380, partial [Coxiellaceae bacterium]|nr:hypothetical protein [Coxiellaceae bacterium]
MRIKSKLLITLALSSSLFINTPLLAKSKHNDLSASLASTSLGFSYIKAGNGAKAKQEFIKAIRQAEDNDAAWYGLAYYYEATGH